MFDPKVWTDIVWLIIDAIILIGVLATGLFAVIETSPPPGSVPDMDSQLTQ